MSLLKEFAIILIILKMGDILHYFIKPVFNLTATIIAMIILFFVLYTELMPFQKIENISNAILKNMAFLFIPLGVKIITQLDIFSDSIMQLVIIILITTIITITVTAIVTEAIIKLINKFKKDVYNVRTNNE